MTHTIHIIGAGVAGLAAAAEAQRLQRDAVIHLYEATKQAGGRCRSFVDPELGVEINNGNHLLLSGNRAMRRFISTIGAADHFNTHTGFTYQMGDFSLRVGGFQSLFQQSLHLVACDAWKMMRAPEDTLLTTALKDSPLRDSFWKLFALSVCNTPFERLSVSPLRNIFRSLIGIRALCPMLPKTNWQRALIIPAIAHLRAHGVFIHLQSRLKSITPDLLLFTDRNVTLSNTDIVILALPNSQAHSLLPEMVPLLPTEPILNMHIVTDKKLGTPFKGFSKGITEWAFETGYGISTTTSAASRYAHLSREEISKQILSELDLPESTPHRLITEQQATLLQNYATHHTRPATKTPIQHLFLAGDYVQTKLPCTLESAAFSGQMAARLSMRMVPDRFCRFLQSL